MRRATITTVIALIVGSLDAAAQSSLAGGWAAAAYNDLAAIGCSPIGPRGSITYDGRVLSLETTTHDFDGARLSPPRTVERRYVLDAPGGTYTLNGVVHSYVVRTVAGSLVVEDTAAPAGAERVGSTTLTILALNNRDELELVHVVPLEWAPERTATCRVVYNRQE